MIYTVGEHYRAILKTKDSLLKSGWTEGMASGALYPRVGTKSGSILPIMQIHLGTTVDIEILDQYTFQTDGFKFPMIIVKELKPILSDMEQAEIKIKEEIGL